MPKKLFFIFLLLTTVLANAKTIIVKNIDELKEANKEAIPGDIIVLQNGDWDNVTISLNCTGTKEKPIIFKAETPGKVIITGNSRLMLGGNYITIDGFYFTKGYAGNDAIIKFRINKDQLANNCRITNTVINDFNNPKRMDDNYWIMFYGKNNRIDHCSFLNKKNMGVMVAVILDDERSRQNFHSIDHNYFGVRLPLASNTGEIIRVGVSEHCEFNSNTQITDNFFEHCDGETEIISIKSGRNYVGNNLFKECQGTVVLRHGNYNTVENNVFLGNNKEGTGGVRIINKGQWVVNNLFYKCRGEGFRSPMSIMNGVPNSPAFRYVAVTDALVANNSFFECTPISFCEGSDTERSVPPKDVLFMNNIFYNHSDSLIYNTYDDISGISFFNNLVSKTIRQNTVNGFSKTSLTATVMPDIAVPALNNRSKNSYYDSLFAESKTRLSTALSLKPGFSDSKLFKQIETNAYSGCGAKWFKNEKTIQKQITVNCKTTEDIIQQLSKNSLATLTIKLTGAEYNFNDPMFISGDVTITSDSKNVIKFSASGSAEMFLLQLKAGKALVLKGLNLDLSGIQSFLSVDTSGSCNHSNYSIINCHFSNLSGTFFNIPKSSISDSIIVHNCTFSGGRGSLFDFTHETNKKGYYNVEKLKITNCSFNNYQGQILGMLRGGNDESTMGPFVIFSNNKITNCNTGSDDALIYMYGTQRSEIKNNSFVNCNTGKTLIHFEDAVRAVHLFKDNRIKQSGEIISDKFVQNINNVVL